MSSIRDIARLSNTSPATVSRVLNNSGYVGKETRQRVEDVVAELGFQPNAGARQMRSGESKLVGILLPTLDVSFFGILAHTMEQELFNNGYHSLICSTAESKLHEAKYVSTLLSQNVDGIIVASTSSDVSHFERVIAENIPIVAIDRTLDGISHHLVAVDHVEGGRIIARYLLDLGHRSIGVIGAPKHSSPIVQRIEGVREVLSSQGLEPAYLNIGSEHSFEACHALAKTVLTKKGRPTAIIGTTDIAAMAGIHAARDVGLRVPQDLSVVGFDDLPETAFILPGLTTVKQPIRKLGQIAVRQLLSVKDPNANYTPNKQDLALELIVRESAAKI